MEGRAWRRSPISPLAYTIRMDGVRQANIYPTCRLDKSNRAVYEPEDVWAKRAGLAKIDSKSNLGGKARGMFKQRVIAMSTARVTKENMEAMDRVKEVCEHFVSTVQLAHLLTRTFILYCCGSGLVSLTPDTTCIIGIHRLRTSTYIIRLCLSGVKHSLFLRACIRRAILHYPAWDYYV